MKVTLTNNSCSRIRRVYPKFEVDVPGHKSVTIAVPDQHVERLKRYLQAHHPAVVFASAEEEQGGSLPVPAARSIAATIADKTVLDINVDDQDEPTVTVEQYLRDLGLLPDPAPEPPVAAQPAASEAPETVVPQASTKRTSNLIPAKPKAGKEKPAAKSTGGKK